MGSQGRCIEAGDRKCFKLTRNSSELCGGDDTMAMMTPVLMLVLMAIVPVLILLPLLMRKW